MPQHSELSSTEEEGRVKTILVVEDDASIGEFLVQVLLQETPYKALLVTDGFQALNIVRNVKPHLLILDYQLPKMNGITLFDELHAMKDLQDTPGIMISARLPKQDIEKRSLVGMHKPFELNELLNTIEKLLA